jgi:DNA-binding CsgD family transcriptional regulator
MVKSVRKNKGVVMIDDFVKIPDDLMRRVVHDSYDEVLRVAHPLFKKTPLTYFCYERIYDSGEIIYLGTGPDLAVKVLLENLFPTFGELRLFGACGLRATFLSHYMPLPLVASQVDPEKYEKLIAAAADCKTYHALFLIDRMEDHYRICGFAVDYNLKSVYNFYINMMSVLDSFIKYFEFHSDDLIKLNSRTNRILLPHYHEKISLNVMPAGINLPFDLSSLDFSVPPPSKIGEAPQLITGRERQVLDFVAQGYTMKSIARKLGISPRTVEQHIRNIKDKHGLNTKDQLIEIWRQYYKRVA